MEEESNDTIIASPSLSDPKVWYIFRRNGQEVKVQIIEGIVGSKTHNLTAQEYVYLYKNKQLIKI